MQKWIVAVAHGRGLQVLLQLQSADALHSWTPRLLLSLSLSHST